MTVITTEYQPVRTERLHESVVRQLLRQIVSGAAAPGSVLPTEPELAQQFGVSRTVVREAVQALATRRLVAVRQGSGMRVESPEQWNHLDPLVLFELVRSGQDGGLLDELIETRRILEVETAAVAALRRTEQDITSLQGILEAMAGAMHDSAGYTDLDNAFHDRILASTRNRVLREALRPVSAVLGPGRLIAARRPGVAAQSLVSHRAIFEGIAAGDIAVAREAMRRHILEFEHDVRVGLRAGALAD